MTLVVSTIEDEEIYLFSDTKVGAAAGPGKGPYHALKILSLSPNTVLAFTGPHDRALEIFYQLHACGAEKLEVDALAGVLAFLRSEGAAQKPDLHGTPDFLLARSGQEPVVFRVDDEGISRCETHAWIGNRRSAARIAAANQSLSSDDLHKAMQSLIADPEFDDVGGHLTVVRSSDTGFQFVPQAGLASPPFLPIEDWRSVDFGAKQAGGFGFTTITPQEPGNNGLGIFFLQGRFGLFFHVNPEKRINEVLKVYAATPKGFIAAVEPEVGFSLQYCA